MGLDFGLIDFISDSEGNTVKHPKHYQKSEKRKNFLDKAFSRTKEGSQNRNKAALSKNKVEQKIVNQLKVLEMQIWFHTKNKSISSRVKINYKTMILITLLIYSMFSISLLLNQKEKIENLNNEVNTV